MTFRSSAVGGVVSLPSRDLPHRVVPHRSADPAYRTMRLTTKNGSVLTGIKSGETLTLQQLLDVVAFLKQASGDRTAPVTLADVAN